MKKHFLPLDHQAKLPMDRLIRKPKASLDDSVPFDVVFVGGGPAGLAGAIRLAQLCQNEKKNHPSFQDIEIGVLEKAGHLGGHSLSGAVVNPMGFRQLFPNLKDQDFPFRMPVTSEEVYFVTESSHWRIPTPPTMKNHGHYTASLAEMVGWLGKKAEDLGVNILTSFPVESLLEEEGRVIGVRTTPAGLNRQGEPGSQHMPSTEVRAQFTVLSEGTRGLLTQSYLNWKKISSPAPQSYALGVKEIWKVKKTPKSIFHTLGWPLPKTAFGGSWLYPLADDLVSIGLVVGLDYREHNLDVHELLQDLKQHPLFATHLEGGEVIEWGAKTIPEGGYHALPETLSGHGVILVGDSLGLVNVPALKGIHYAMMSGIYAAESIFAALKRGTSDLTDYDSKVRDSFIGRDLYKVRNMRLAFKSGFYVGGIKAALMTATRGLFPGGPAEIKEDAAEEKIWSEHKALQSKSTPIPRLKKVDAVYLSGNKTRDDIPSHLIVGEDIPKEVAEFYSHLCPAGVYELQGERLLVNAPNCVDCKATDILGPRWTPREGGSGPSYSKM